MTEVERALTQRINEEHRACEAAAASAVQHAICCGQMLSEVKAELPHGAFGSWIRENFAGSERTAQTYMRLYRGRDALGKTQRAADLSIREALRELEPANEAPPERLPDWNLLAFFIEDHFPGPLFDGEAALIVARTLRGPKDEIDHELRREVARCGQLLSDERPAGGAKDCAWALRRAVEKWVLAVVEKEGTSVQKARRYKYEAGVCELEGTPEAWEVFRHVTGV